MDRSEDSSHARHRPSGRAGGTHRDPPRRPAAFLFLRDCFMRYDSAMQKQRVSSGANWESIVGYSRAVRIGPHVHVSGTTGVDATGNVVSDDPYQQAVRALEIIRDALEELGATMSDVVRTRMYVTNIDDWDRIGKAHAEFFSDTRPASTMVEVQRLITPDILVEIEAEAFVGDRFSESAAVSF